MRRSRLIIGFHLCKIKKTEVDKTKEKKGKKRLRLK